MSCGHPTGLILYICSPEPFCNQRLVLWKTIFPQTGIGGDGFSMIQVPYIYCALYLYYPHISSTSDHQVLDPGGWGLLLYVSQIKFIISIGRSTPVLCSRL